MKKSNFKDPFKEQREQQGTAEMDDQGDPVTMVLRLKDVRKCAHDWNRFRSGATPGRIVVPSEVHIRGTRQIPFEVDPPLHKKYRDLMEDWFRRPLQEPYRSALRAQIQELVDHALKGHRFEIVEDFALPLQSKALTLLLNIPLSEAEVWISWGTHVFRSEETKLDKEKASILYDYIDRKIEDALAAPGEDLYSKLLTSELDGRRLTKEEVKGVMILTFAGGRDTIINAVTNSLVYLAEHPEQLVNLRKHPELAARAVEELIRYYSPLTHMGRVASEDTSVCEHAVKSNTRISLCWASANRDESVFDRPDEVILDRKMNPHVGFGFGHHKCLGATHARQVLMLLLQVVAENVTTIEIEGLKENIEDLDRFERQVGFQHVWARFQ